MSYPLVVMRFVFALALALSARSAHRATGRPARRVEPSAAQNDAQSDAAPMDTGIVDTGVPPMDTGVVVDTGVARHGRRLGHGVQPPCTALDPRNCGMCGRVCGQGALSGRPACAEVSTGRWDCVNRRGIRSRMLTQWEERSAVRRDATQAGGLSLIRLHRRRAVGDRAVEREQVRVRCRRSGHARA